MLIVFAWFFEIFGVIFGAANSLYVTFGEPDKWPTSVVAFFPAAPLIVLAACELLRIPMAKLFHMPRPAKFRALILLAFIGAWGIGIENWLFGIERMVYERLKPVEIVRLQLREAEQAIVDRNVLNEKRAANLKTVRDSVNVEIAAANEANNQLAKEVANENAASSEAVKSIESRGMKIADKIIASQSTAEMARHEKALADIRVRQEANAATVKQKQAAIVAAEVENKQVNDPPMETLVAKTVAVKSQLAQVVKDNSIHRIAGNLFLAKGQENLTDEQLAWAKNVFSWFGAIIVSGIAGAIALAYYAPVKQPWMMRTLRAWMLRLRKRVVKIVKVDVEKIVKVDVPGPAEKEIPILMRETTVKIVPVRGLEGEQQPFAVVDKITGPEAEAKLHVVRGDKP